MTYGDMLAHLAAAGKARWPSWPEGYYLQAGAPRTSPLLAGLGVVVDQWDPVAGRFLPWDPALADKTEPLWQDAA